MHEFSFMIQANLDRCILIGAVMRCSFIRDVCSKVAAQERDIEFLIVSCSLVEEK